MKKQVVDEKVWAELPEDLLLEIMKEVHQEHILLITNVKVSGFRVGKIPSHLLFPKAVKAYQESELVKERLHRYLIENTKDLRQELTGVTIKKLKQRAIELISNKGRNRVILSLFLDPRKGTKKIAKELWETPVVIEEELHASEVSAQEVSSSKDQSGETKGAAKLERRLIKKEKRLIEESKKYRLIISSRDKKITQLKGELKANHKNVQQLEQNLISSKEKELDQKILVNKLKDDLSAISGQLKKLSKDNQALTRENNALERENNALKIALQELQEKDVISKEAEEAEEFSDLTILQGQFSFLAGEGWLIAENQLFNIPIDLIKENNLVTGDLIEIDFESANGEKIFNLRVLEKLEGQEMSGYLIFHNQDYWVKAGLELIHVGEEEVQRVRAVEGDPVSIMVPLKAERKLGYITKVHRVYDIKQLPEKKSGAVKIRELNQNKKNLIQTLKERKLLVVGGDNLKHRYIQELEALGAKVEWQSGFGEIAAIPKRVSRAEVVLLLTSNNSHTATNLARQAVQLYHKQVLYYHSTSIKGAVQAVVKFFSTGQEITAASNR